MTEPATFVSPDRADIGELLSGVRTRRERYQRPEQGPPRPLRKDKVSLVVGKRNAPPNEEQLRDGQATMVAAATAPPRVLTCSPRCGHRWAAAVRGFVSWPMGGAS